MGKAERATMKKVALIFLMGVFAADAGFNLKGNNVHIFNYNGFSGDYELHAFDVNNKMLMDVMEILKTPGLTPGQVQQELQNLHTNYRITIQNKNVRIEGNANGGNIPPERRRQQKQPKRQQQQANAGYVGNNARYTEYIDNIGGIMFRAFNVDKRFMDAIRYLQTTPLLPEQIEYQLKQLQREGYLMEIGSPLQDTNVGHVRNHDRDSYNVRNHDRDSYNVRNHDRDSYNGQYQVYDGGVFNDVQGYSTWTGQPQQGNAELQRQQQIHLQDEEQRKREQERESLERKREELQRERERDRDEKQRRYEELQQQREQEQEKREQEQERREQELEEKKERLELQREPKQDQRDDKQQRREEKQQIRYHKQQIRDAKQRNRQAKQLSNYTY